MKKIKLVILLAIISALTKAQDLTPELVYQKVCNSVLKMNAYDEDNYKTSGGSAVVISNSGIVVTSYHIFKGAVRITIPLQRWNIPLCGRVRGMLIGLLKIAYKSRCFFKITTRIIKYVVKNTRKKA